MRDLLSKVRPASNRSRPSVSSLHHELLGATPAADRRVVTHEASLQVPCDTLFTFIISQLYQNKNTILDSELGRQNK